MVKVKPAQPPSNSYWVVLEELGNRIPGGYTHDHREALRLNGGATRYVRCQCTYPGCSQVHDVRKYAINTGKSLSCNPCRKIIRNKKRKGG